MNVSNIPIGGGAPPPAPPDIPKLSIALCRKCGRPIDPNFAFCPYCGQRQKQGFAWYYDPVWIVILALFVLGPFTLGLVWRSARMDRTAKIALTAGILVYTAFTFYYFYRAMAYELQGLSDLNELLR